MADEKNPMNAKFKAEKDPASVDGAGFKSSTNVGDKTGWGGNKNPGVKNSGKNMQSSGYDTAGEEAKGHSQK